MTTTYTPAEAAEASGLSLDTLRYYEREGILPPIARSTGGHRVYRDSDLLMLGLLRCLRDTGMSIGQLRRYGELSRDDGTVPERLSLLEEHAAGIQSRIEALEAARIRVLEKVEWYRTELRNQAAC